jgi:hypothetical protein
MKLCKDCKYAEITVAGASVDCRCHHPQAAVPPQPDYISGNPGKALPGNAVWIRDDPDRCGPDGKWWEPKQPPEPVGFVDDDPPPRAGGAMEQLA